MTKIASLAATAAVIIGVAAFGSTLASAKPMPNLHNSITPAPGLSNMRNNGTPAPGLSSVQNGGAYNPGAQQGGQIGKFPHDPIPGPAKGGMGGGHNHGIGVSFGVYQSFDPAYFCRYVVHKHRPVKVCYLPQAAAPVVSLGFGF